MRVMTLRALVVDDEPPARRRLLRLLEAHPEVLVVGEADSGPEAVRQIREVEPDLLLLDIQLPEFDGFEVLSQVAAPPAVIFTTGYDQYALRAFEAAGIDYLLKPVEPETLERALGRLRRLAPEAAREGLEERVHELLKS
jgi:two-component system LytT family response regulator